MSRPEFPNVQMNLARRSAPAIAKVVSNDLCMNGKSASFVKHLVLDIGDTPLRGTFTPGQSFGVIAEGDRGGTKGSAQKVRLYSIACASWGEDGEGRYISTTPKRLIDEVFPAGKTEDLETGQLFLGVCSNFLCDRQIGDEVRVTGPVGQRFLLPTKHDDHNYLFLATGTGIAPFRGMLKELLENPLGGPCRSRVDLIMGAPYRTDLLYHKWLCDLADQHENFSYHVAVSREILPGTRSGLYIDGLIDQNFETFAPLLQDQRTLIYACGLEAMRYGMVRVLAKHDIGDNYFRVGEDLVGRNYSEWSDAEIRKMIKPTERTHLEVY